MKSGSASRVQGAQRSNDISLRLQHAIQIHIDSFQKSPHNIQMFQETRLFFPYSYIFTDALSPFKTGSMEDCMEHCSRYWGNSEGCYGVVWNEDDTNCWLILEGYKPAHANLSRLDKKLHNVDSWPHEFDWNSLCFGPTLTTTSVRHQVPLQRQFSTNSGFRREFYNSM